MNELVFITGNQSKADYLTKYLGFPVQQHKLDLDEIQSLDLKEIVEHKVRQAYDIAKKPVIVEDVSLEFTALGKLPGTFIKFFMQELSFDGLCRLVDGKSRQATAKCAMAYYDGHKITFFEKQLSGTIAQEPKGENGWGWDKIFIPEGYTTTRASLNEEDDRKTYLQIKPFDELKRFLEKR